MHNMGKVKYYPKIHFTSSKGDLLVPTVKEWNQVWMLSGFTFKGEKGELFRSPSHRRKGQTMLLT